MPPTKPGLFKRFQSYFYPQRIRSASSSVNTILDLYYYRGRWQLGTADALYSDGAKYRPLLAAFNLLHKELPTVKSILVLGTGLGSAVHILSARGLFPNYTLVDLDSVILKWAMELMPEGMGQYIKPVCADAGQFIEKEVSVYDLIIVDVFIGRYVPGFVTTPEFLNHCRRCLTKGGHLVLNFMVNHRNDENRAKALLETVFSSVQEVSFYINRVYIAKNQ